jgi:hypothetical protein
MRIANKRHSLLAKISRGRNLVDSSIACSGFLWRRCCSTRPKNHCTHFHIFHGTTYLMMAAWGYSLRLLPKVTNCKQGCSPVRLLPKRSKTAWSRCSASVLVSVRLSRSDHFHIVYCRFWLVESTQVIHNAAERVQLEGNTSATLLLKHSRRLVRNSSQTFWQQILGFGPEQECLQGAKAESRKVDCPGTLFCVEQPFAHATIHRSFTVFPRSIALEVSAFSNMEKMSKSQNDEDPSQRKLRTLSGLVKPEEEVTPQSANVACSCMAVYSQTSRNTISLP